MTMTAIPRLNLPNENDRLLSDWVLFSFVSGFGCMDPCIAELHDSSGGHSRKVLFDDAAITHGDDEPCLSDARKNSQRDAYDHQI